MANDDERIALFLDYENLAIGARDGLGVSPFDFGPVADALAERGRVVVRRAYADWSSFGEDRRLLARAQIELIEIPQRIGGSRKNAADIKLTVDAIELAYERDFVTTFAIGTGDSDFTPLVNKLRELDKRVIGIGVQSSTSALLPPACDEFLFYDRLPGIEATPVPRRGRARAGSRSPQPTPAAEPASTEPQATQPASSQPPSSQPPSSQPPSTQAASGQPTFGQPAFAQPSFAEPAAVVEPEDTPAVGAEPDVGAVVARTLTGLQRHSDGPVLASRLKRAMLRKDPTFDEGDHGFRGFGELLRNLEGQGVLALRRGSAQGDPEVTFPENESAEEEAFRLLVDVVRGLQAGGGPPQLSGLKNTLRKRVPDFTEKRYGFNSFLSFAKAARARDLVEMDWDEETGDYLLRVP